MGKVPQRRAALGFPVGAIDDVYGGPRFVGRLYRPYLGEDIGYPGVAIDAARLDLAGGGLLELLDYRPDGRVPIPRRW